MNNRHGFFVHVDLGDGSPVVAGYHFLDKNAQQGYFVYGASYCENPDAFAIDPINLPLVYGQRFYFVLNREACGIPGAFLDGGPDEWGKRILNRFAEPKPINAADYLVMGSGHGVGALKFADSKDPIVSNSKSGEIDLDSSYESAMAFDIASGEDLSQLEVFLMPSSGIGGARPKAQVLYEGKPCIAKFNRKDDLFDNALVEFAMMKLAVKAGINCANVYLEHTQHGHCVLVERFDYLDEEYRVRGHLLSAHSLLNVYEMSQLDQISYDRIAAIGKQISKDKNIAEQVFLRMLFNIAIGNTDDHSRNHAFLKNGRGLDYKLSPAYDLVPLPQRLAAHAINIGPFGQNPTLENITSTGKLMGLSQNQQQSCALKICSALEGLGDYLADIQVDSRDLGILKPCFNQIKAIEKIAQQKVSLF